MEIGLLLPTRGVVLSSAKVPDVGVIFDLARQAEEHGYDAVWVGDSVVAKPRLEPLTTLAALSQATRRITLGTAIHIPSLRHPVPLAHSLATLACLAPGRLVWGIGVGTKGAGYEEEWMACGVPSHERAQRLEEAIEIVKGLLRGEPFLFNGKCFQFPAVRMFPAPVPKILLATGHGRFLPRQHVRARLADGVIMNLDSPPEVARLRSAILEQAAKLGRDPASLHFAMYMTIHVGNDAWKATREAEAWLADYYLRRWGQGRIGPFGPPALIVDRFDEYAGAGIQSFCVRFAAYNQQLQFERFTSEVLPGLRSLGCPDERGKECPDSRSE